MGILWLKNALLWSLYVNQAKEEGFDVYRYHSIRNHEKERVLKTVRKWASEKVNGNSSNKDLSALLENKDSSRYYNKVMGQKDVFEIDTIPVDIRNYITYNSDSKKLNFNFSDTLMVVYKRYRKNIATNSINYLSTIPYQLLKENRLMFLTDNNGINISEGGLSTPNDLYMIGDMARRSLSRTLPLNYNPKEGRKLYNIVGF
ncbi:MAG: hypothetical protein EOO93_31520 [Pedobacter sp.]|nr:MAG: hypothetical protein EOO93_31520 [Pedobacter sp.]